MNIQAFLSFMNTAEKLKCNTRHSYTSNGRIESVAEHSWRLALMAYLVRDEFPSIDIDKVILMCLFHDIGEAITGDIPAFEKTSRDTANEDRIVFDLMKQFPEPYCSDLNALFLEMNALTTEEAKLYKALDKLEALIQHNEADISTWLPLEYDLQMTYGEKECSFAPYIHALREQVRQDSVSKIEKQARRTDTY